MEANPKTEDVQITVTKVFNKKPAPGKQVYFILKLTHGKQIWSSQYLIDRSGMPKNVEDAIKQKLKINFVQQVIEKLNGKQEQKPRIKTID